MSHRVHPAAVARTSDAARQGRSEADWALVNDPEGARSGTARVLAGDADERERIMRQGFARTFVAYNRRDWELNTLLLHPNYVFRAADVHEALPDFDEEAHGVEGYLEAMELWLETWSEPYNELVDLLAVDQDRAVTLVRWAGVGARSGTPFEQLLVQDHVFRDGLTVAQTYWWNAARGAGALGLHLPSRRG